MIGYFARKISKSFRISMFMPSGRIWIPEDESYFISHGYVGSFLTPSTALKASVCTSDGLRVIMVSLSNRQSNAQAEGQVPAFRPECRGVDLSQGKFSWDMEVFM